MPDLSKMKLGRKPKRIDHLNRTLKMSRYVAPGIQPKDSVDWFAKVPAFGLYANGPCPEYPEGLGDCAIVAIANMVRMWTANLGNEVIPSLEDVVSVYKILSPDDSGCVLLDVLKYWRQNPICGVQIGAFAAVNLSDQNDVKLGIDLFGGIYSGVELPTDAQNQSIWTPTDGPGSIPSGWGDHCVPWGKYDASGLACATWAAIQAAIWNWFTKYCDEAYVLISPNWLDGSGRTPEGFDAETLLKDLSVVAA